MSAAWGLRMGKKEYQVYWQWMVLNRKNLDLLLSPRFHRKDRRQDQYVTMKTGELMNSWGIWDRQPESHRKWKYSKNTRYCYCYYYYYNAGLCPPIQEEAKERSHSIKVWQLWWGRHGVGAVSIKSNCYCLLQLLTYIYLCIVLFPNFKGDIQLFIIENNTVKF